MAIELTMPALSPTMEKGNLAKWLVAEGDRVKPGDLLAEIETDKATMEYEAIDEGIVARLVVPSGTEDVAVGTVIALLAGSDEAVAVLVVVEPAVAEAVAAPAAAPPRAIVALPDPAPAPAPPRSSPATPIKVSPIAQRIADMKGIDLSGIAGSGPNGRILRADLSPSPSPPVAHVADAVAPVAVISPPPEGVPAETVKLSTMRKTIARRLAESKQNVPHFYLTARCNLNPLLRLRGELNEALAARGLKLSVNDLMIKALALALTEVPDANVQLGGDVLHHFARADIAMAVAIDGGLVTPVVRDAGSLSLSHIAQASKALILKAREGRLTPQDYEGGTASISNLGMFCIDEMFPVINPPQALILGVAAGIEQPWNVDGQLALATVMAATASFDHRAIDGATAAQFMQALRELVENPILLVG